MTGLIGNADRSKIKAHRLMGDLYEPTAIAVYNDKIYPGEKDKISRLEDRNATPLPSRVIRVRRPAGSKGHFRTHELGKLTV